VETKGGQSPLAARAARGGVLVARWGEGPPGVLHVKLRLLEEGAPEVKVGDTWYVVDITYTTPESPVKASEYAEHLRATKPSLYSKVKGVIEAYTGRDLSAEHGFAAKGG
jgi:hypothetical protein